ncbi:MAG: M20/M25/M40 family metallo-hydrolase [Acidimicrobiales bacterium]
MRTKGIAAALAVVGAIGVGSAVLAAPANEADDRFDQITGPMGKYVVRPEDFGIDASRTLVDVPSLLAQVDAAREKGVIDDLDYPRTAAGPESNRQDVRDYISEALADAGYEVQTQSVVLDGVDSPNLYAELPGTECPSRSIVIGAHHDTLNAKGSGADDNTSGTAGMLELARILHDHPLPVTVRFASWSYEEVGLVGSFAMAREMKADGRALVGAISLEMIGYTEPDTDPLTGLPGTYLAMVSDPTSAPVARAFGAAAYTYVPEFPGFGAVIDPNVLPDILRSDHAAFLASGYPVLMATDTANFRNPNYHQATDTPDTIDVDFLGGSTRAALAGLVTLASVDQDQDGRADACTRSLAATTTTTVPTTATTAVGGGTGATPATPVDGTSSFTG